MPAVAPLAALLGALLLLLAPFAGAASTSGHFLARGSLGLPAHAVHDLEARLVYSSAHEEREAIASLRIEAPVVRLRYFERDFVQAGVGNAGVYQEVPRSGAEETHAFTDATVTLLPDGRHAGWLALFTPGESAPLSFEAWAPTRVTGQGWTSLGDRTSDVSEREEPRPEINGFSWRSQGPQLVLEGPGHVRREGAAMILLQGPDLLVRSAEGERSFPTGWATPQPAGFRHDQWAFLEIENGTVTFSTSGLLTTVALSDFAEWSGTAVLTPTEGRITSAGREYVATGRPERLSGDLSALVTPAAQDNGASTLLRMDLSGDLAETTLLAADGGGAARIPDAEGGAWEAAVAAAVAVLLAGLGVALVVARRRQAAVPAEAAGLVRLVGRRQDARAALAGATFEEPEARDSARLLREASHLASVGRVEEALARYAAASARMPDGDADFQAAVLLLQRTDNVRRAEELLARALSRSPILVLELLYDGTGVFAPLRERQSFQRVVEDARRTLGEIA